MGSAGGGRLLLTASDVNRNSLASGQSLKRSSASWVNDTFTKADVVLINVDNTSDSNKPLSSAKITALVEKRSQNNLPTPLSLLRKYNKKYRIER